jgi:hypothetical protein
MKNIFILPTSKETNIALIDKKILEYDPIVRYQTGMGVDGIHTQNLIIYIVIESTLKLNDYYISPFSGGVLFKWDNFNVKQFPSYKGLRVVFTTDPDLIKDGVQSIDGDFINWLVKNPSYDKIQLEGFNRASGYELIIPKIDKTQTVEDAAYHHAKNHGMMAYVSPEKTESFIKGAKWQEQRMYSEEELLKFGKSCFYKGFEKSEKDDANCYTAFREEIGGLFEPIKKE